MSYIYTYFYFILFLNYLFCSGGMKCFNVGGGKGPLNKKQSTLDEKLHDQWSLRVAGGKWSWKTILRAWKDGKLTPKAGGVDKRLHFDAFFAGSFEDL